MLKNVWQETVLMESLFGDEEIKEEINLKGIPFIQADYALC